MDEIMKTLSFAIQQMIERNIVQERERVFNLVAEKLGMKTFYLSIDGNSKVAVRSDYDFEKDEYTTNELVEIMKCGHKVTYFNFDPIV